MNKNGSISRDSATQTVQRQIYITIANSAPFVTLYLYIYNISSIYADNIQRLRFRCAYTARPPRPRLVRPPRRRTYKTTQTTLSTKNVGAQAPLIGQRRLYKLTPSLF
jgi:hypothetical protein